MKKDFFFSLSPRIRTGQKLADPDPKHFVRYSTIYTRNVIDILQATAPTILHADPQLVASQVGTEVRHNVGVQAVLHHQDFLQKDSYVDTWKKERIF